MWIINTVLIFAGIAFISLFWGKFAEEVIRAMSFFFSGFQSILIVIFQLLRHALVGAIIGAVGGIIFSAIFHISGAPMNVVWQVAVAVGLGSFSVWMLKALVEEWSNLYWSIRNARRNTYRPRR
ncbi:hypothetical protein H6F66_26245 [Trichocoleus sp. FACHB-6]|nr:hypothetical protein [Microcoleus sp. FACHB-831]MBD1922503.1 hypothetical protein [Microcoleus sp. FACHB-831]MBD2065719.1 hypothetical protein [Trichocoleus sp. FACHB-6]